MSAIFNKFEAFIEELAEGSHDLGSDQLVLALTNSPPLTSDTVIGDISQIAYTYASSRSITTVTSAQIDGVYKLVVSDIELLATGGSIGPFRYGVIYNDTSATDLLVGWLDYGTSLTISAGASKTVELGGDSGLLTLNYDLTEFVYCENQDVYDIFGKTNVLEWANMLELATSHADYDAEISRRMKVARQYATNDMDELLRGGSYLVPFTGDAITRSVARCCALKAGSWLFEWRRDEEEDRYAKMEAKADMLLEQIRKDVRRLDESNQTVKGTRAPSAIT